MDCSSYSFLIESGRELISDRAHSSTFQSDFDQLNGCIYRIHEKDGRTAYDLLMKDWYDENGEDNGTDNNIEFIAEHDSSFIELIRRLIQESPVGEIVFTSDYQFGPDEFTRFEKLKMSDFLTIYKNNKLRINSLYRVTGC